MTNPKTIDEILLKHVQELRAGHEHLIKEQIHQLIEEKLPKEKTHKEGTSTLTDKGYETLNEWDVANTPYELTYNQALADVHQVLNEIFKEQ